MEPRSSWAVAVLCDFQNTVASSGNSAPVRFIIRVPESVEGMNYTINNILSSSSANKDATATKMVCKSSEDM